MFKQSYALKKVKNTEYFPQMVDFSNSIIYFKVILYEFIHANLCLKSSTLSFLFSIRFFFHGHWRPTWQQGKGGDHLLFYSTSPTRSRTFSYLFSTLHVRWLSHIFNLTACIYHTTTRWMLPPYRITIWLIDDIMLIFVCLLDDLILGFCYSNLTRETSELKVAFTITLVQ